MHPPQELLAEAGMVELPPAQSLEELRLAVKRIKVFSDQKHAA
jgi:hypothetical protein